MLQKNEAPWRCAFLGPSWESGPFPNLFSAGLVQLSTSPTIFLCHPSLEGWLVISAFPPVPSHEEGL